LKEIDEFLENHQQSKEQKDDAKEEEDGISQEQLECELSQGTRHHAVIYVVRSSSKVSYFFSHTIIIQKI
jgi:hypothetical protein